MCTVGNAQQVTFNSHDVNTKSEVKLVSRHGESNSSSLLLALKSLSLLHKFLSFSPHISTTSSMTNVVELKVGLHCEECIKKILKTIKKFEDIEAYDVDTKLNKVIVTGNVTNEEVIRALQKIGKQATNWEQV
ncbi:hypothetical protein L2E82_22294 [Cichorium intybus]|uniref:Uncharacterized protein n=1 Tax=Cichorium intybus TaxID=13427 RepID=A0ACB9DXN5_CICIN|nr:hypothetical protein L2E82_22294 [Cichorium intybus]